MRSLKEPRDGDEVARCRGISSILGTTGTSIFGGGGGAGGGGLSGDDPGGIMVWAEAMLPLKNTVAKAHTSRMAMDRWAIITDMS
jgi:hypothetical protein